MRGTICCIAASHAGSLFVPVWRSQVTVLPLDPCLPTSLHHPREATSCGLQGTCYGARRWVCKHALGHPIDPTMLVKTGPRLRPHTHSPPSRCQWLGARDIAELDSRACPGRTTATGIPRLGQWHCSTPEQSHCNRRTSLYAIHCVEGCVPHQG